MKKIFLPVGQSVTAEHDFSAYVNLINLRRSYWGCVVFCCISAVYFLSDLVLDLLLPEYINPYTSLDIVYAVLFLLFAYSHHKIIHRVPDSPINNLHIILFNITVVVFMSWGMIYSYFDIVKIGNNNLYSIMCVSLVIVFHLNVPLRIIIFLNVVIINFLFYQSGVKDMDNLLFIFSNSVVVILIGLIVVKILYTERRHNFLAIKELLGFKKEKSRAFFDKYHITPKEGEVIHLLAMGHTYREIADDLIISEYTVKTHIKNIYEKTQVSNKVHLINLMKHHSIF